MVMGMPPDAAGASNGLPPRIVLGLRAPHQVSVRHGLMKTGPVISASANCGSSKLDPSEFIGGFELLATAWVHADADQRSAPSGPKQRTQDPYLEALLYST